MKTRNLINFSTLELAIRIFTALFIAIYGLAKPFQFAGDVIIDTPVNELSGMQLMWVFFGYSLSYPVFIGLIQVTGAGLLIFERTKLIGALVLTPVFLNIIFLDIVFEVLLGALINAIVFQLVLCYIIWQQRKKVSTALKSLYITPIKFKAKEGSFLRFLAAFILAIILFYVYQYLINILFSSPPH